VSNKKLAKLRRVQDLFTHGQVAVVTRGSDYETFWVQKPTAFERDEATKDGRAARARRVIAFDRDPDEQAVSEAQLANLDREQSITGLLANRSSEFYVKANEAIRADKDWTERIEAMERGEALLNEEENPDESEVRAIGEVHVEYLQQMQKLQKRLADEARAEYEELTDEQLAKEYRKAWRDMVGTDSFMATRRQTELYFAIRMCEAAPIHDDDGSISGWDHAACDHRERLLDERSQFTELPDEVIEACASTLNSLQMTPAEAGNSAAPTTSSVSSEQPNAAEDSTPSTQTETSPEPAGT
jgi:hypothetical protein